METIEKQESLYPVIPVLEGYINIKRELEVRLEKFNKIKVLDEDNKKEVKAAIAEINKVKDKVARYRIDETAVFLKHIDAYVSQCKDIEKICTEGLVAIKAKVSALEEEERQCKIDSVKQLFDFTLEPCPYRKMFNFDMFFEPSMGNKTSNLNVLESQMKEWIASKESDIDFIKKQTDDAEAIIAIYLGNGLALTKAIESYQEIYRSQSEIKAMMETESVAQVAPVPCGPTTFNYEKKVNIVVKITQLPQSKVKALESFLDGLGVDWAVELA